MKLYTRGGSGTRLPDYPPEKVTTRSYPMPEFSTITLPDYYPIPDFTTRGYPNFPKNRKIWKKNPAISVDSLVWHIYWYHIVLYPILSKNCSNVDKNLWLLLLGSFDTRILKNYTTRRCPPDTRKITTRTTSKCNCKWEWDKHLKLSNLSVPRGTHSRTWNGTSRLTALIFH